MTTKHSVETQEFLTKQPMLCRHALTYVALTMACGHTLISEMPWPTFGTGRNRTRNRTGPSHEESEKRRPNRVEPGT